MSTVVDTMFDALLHAQSALTCARASLVEGGLVRNLLFQGRPWGRGAGGRANFDPDPCVISPSLDRAGFWGFGG